MRGEGDEVGGRGIKAENISISVAIQVFQDLRCCFFQASPANQKNSSIHNMNMIKNDKTAVPLQLKSEYSPVRKGTCCSLQAEVRGIRSVSLANALHCLCSTPQGGLNPGVDAAINNLQMKKIA